MKSLLLVPLVLGLVAACAQPAADAPKLPPRTEVVFDHPENFTDVKDSSIPSDSGRDEILSRIRSFLVDRADTMIPAGDKLKITFTDIDLAGDYEPWRGPQWSDVRVVKPIYPPAFKFTYTVTDPSGRVVKEASEDLRDLTFQSRIMGHTDDPLRYEKDMLNDWMHASLRDLGKT
jgi:hypothetical protein